MWPWIQNNIPIILIAVSFGVSGLGWLFKKMQEAKEAKRVEDARKRARLEALRTGRIDGQQQAPQASRTAIRPAPQAETPRQRLEDLARRRQQGQQPQQQRPPTQRTELEEQLRRRREAIDAQRQRQQQQRQPSPARTPGQRPGQTPTQRPAPPPPQRTAQQTTVKPTPQPRRTGERRPISPLPTMQPVQETVIEDVIAATRAREDRPLQAPIAVPGAGRRSVPILAGGIDLRKAVIMREIFDKPVGLRDPRDPGW